MLSTSHCDKCRVTAGGGVGFFPLVNNRGNNKEKLVCSRSVFLVCAKFAPVFSCSKREKE